MRFLVYLILSAATVAVGCGRKADCSHDVRGDEHADTEQSGAHESHDGEIVIHNEQAEELGIKVTEVVMTDFSVPVVASGEVIYNPSNQGVISAPMSGRINFDKGISAGTKVSRGMRIGRISTSGMAGGDQLAAARIEYEAAKKEVERLTPLRQDGIVTVGEYNQAVADMERAKNNLSGGAGSVVTAPMTGVISSLSTGEGGYVEAGEVVGEITGSGAMTLRVDVPVRESSRLQDVKRVKAKFPQIEETVEAVAISGDYSSSETPGYLSFYFQLPEIEHMAVGSVAEVYIPGSVTRQIITVPLSAVTDRIGQKMVYVREGENEHYRRVPVETGASDGESVEVTGLNPGDLVVTEGVTFVRLAENSGATPPGHTHNH